MPSTHRTFVPGAYYHIYNRGTDKKTLFLRDTDYLFFLNKLSLKKDEFRVRIVAYCIMPNHYHLLIIEPETRDQWSNKAGSMVHRLQTSYAMYFNQRNETSGYVFQGRFAAKQLDTNKYLAWLICYIHYNPVDAGLVNAAEEWPYSSARLYLGGASDRVVTKDTIFSLGDHKEVYREYLQKRADRDEFVRRMLRSGGRI